jgi:hypothetical protein
MMRLSTEHGAAEVVEDVDGWLYRLCGLESLYTGPFATIHDACAAAERALAAAAKAGNRSPFI